jgi:hypothetical protein
VRGERRHGRNLGLRSSCGGVPSLGLVEGVAIKVIFAYADPPYPGQSKKHYCDHAYYAGEVDHAELVDRLERDFDGWVLHTSGPACFYVQSLLAERGLFPIIPGEWRGGDYRVMAWVKPFAAFKRNVSVAYAWEPVLVKALRKPVVSGRIVMRDWEWTRTDDLASAERDFIAESITLKKGLSGVKPEKVCRWAFEMVGAELEDGMHDLFPGSGAVTAAWRTWCEDLTEAAA